MKLFILINLLIYFFTGHLALSNDSKKLVNTKQNDKLQKSELIKLNAKISNFKCGHYSQKSADAIQKKLNLQILKQIKNEKISTTLNELNNKWISIIDKCNSLSEVNLNNQELQNELSIVRNQSYTKYLNILIDFHQTVGRSKKHFLDYYYEFNICNSFFRLGRLDAARDCFNNLIASHHYQKLGERDKIKLYLSTFQVEFDKYGCQLLSKVDDQTEVKTLPDLIGLIKNIVFEICKNNSKASTELINQLSRINETKQFDYDFEYELFYYRYSQNIVSKNYETAKTIIRDRLLASKEKMTDYNHNLYLEASLQFIEMKYQEAKNQLVKIMNYKQFSPIMAYRMVFLACLSADSEKKKICNPDQLQTTKNLDKKYSKMINSINRIYTRKSNSDVSEILDEITKNPGSIELYF